MSETPPAETSKTLIRSKTFWLQVLTILAVLIPGVQEWFAKNPVEPIAVLAALNIIVRFATSGRVTVFRDGNSEDDGDKPSGPAGWAGLFAFLCMAAALLTLPSCTASDMRVGLNWAAREAAYEVIEATK